MKYKIILFVCLFGIKDLQAQKITFSFENAFITTDGTNHFYEADIMIVSTQDLILGSGLLYFNYNNAAFGSNISAAGTLEVTHASPDYICGQKDNVVGTIDLYGPFVQNDTTDSRFAFSFLQAFGYGSFPGNNVTATPTKLFHLKIQYVDYNEDPIMAFETAQVFLDQFSTACGLGTSLSPANCSEEPGIQLFNDFFDSSQSPPLSTLNIQPSLDSIHISVFPNPADNILNISIPENQSINSINLFNILGEKLLSTERKTIDVSHLQSGIYLIKISTEKGQVTKRIVIQ